MPVNHKYWANQFVDKFGEKIRFNEDWGSWLEYVGTHWSECSVHPVLSCFDEWVDELKISQKKSQKVVEDWKKKQGLDSSTREPSKVIKAEEKLKYCENALGILTNINNQESILKYVTRYCLVRTDELDRYEHLLNCKNGTVNLRTGELARHNPNDSITKIVDYDYNLDAKTPVWDSFLKDIMGDDQEMVEFLKILAGYSATGSVKEHILLMFYGTGRNGKSTFCETLLHILRGYGQTVTHDFFASKKSDSHMTAIADLCGSRLIVGSEFTGNTLNEPLVKRLTGGDTIKARRMRQDYFEFEPTHTIFVLVNARPNITGTDEGIWARVVMVPFEVRIPDEKMDKDLKDKLRTEGEGILSWIVEGAKLWYREGVNLPDKVKSAVEDYKQDMDVVGTFIEQCTIRHPASRVKSSEILNYLKIWCDNEGHWFKPNAKWFANEMRQKGYESVKSTGVMHWRGLKMIPDVSAELNGSQNVQGGREGGSHVGSAQKTVGESRRDNGNLPPSLPDCSRDEFDNLSYSDRISIILELNTKLGIIDSNGVDESRSILESSGDLRLWTEYESAKDNFLRLFSESGSISV